MKICFIPLLFVASYGVNSETSEIGSINSTCQNPNAWNDLTEKYSIDKIQDSSFIEGLKLVKNHFIKPKYILYFESGPKKIIGCDFYTIRVAYNPKIFDGDINGLTPALSDNEQVRIRNRVLNLLYQYECKEGKKLISKEMGEPATYWKRLLRK